MTPLPPSGHRPPWWTLAALPVLLVLPAPVATGVLAGAMALRVAWPALRRYWTRLGESSPAPPAAAATSVGGPLELGREPHGRPVALDERQLGAHALILGASGSGKSTTLLRLLSEGIAQGQPVVAIDLKGSPEFAHTLAQAAAAAGRRLQLFSADGPQTWNPLRHGNATELKDKLISTERFTEPHYQRAAERYLQQALQALLDCRGEAEPTLAAVVDALEPRRLAALARDLPAERAERLQEYLSSLTPDQHSAVRGLATRLAILSESHTGRYLESGNGGIDLRRALDGGEVVLFSLNSSVYGQLAAQLGTLAIQDLVAATGRRLSEGGGSPSAAHTPALVAIDEFSALHSDNVLSLVARGRGSQVSLLLATQEMADLHRAGRGFADQVMGNTTVKIVHRQDVPESARVVAQMTGTQQVWDHTYTQGGSGLARTRQSRVASRQVERFLVHPNEIMSLRTGEAVLITKSPHAQVRTITVAPPRLPESSRPVDAPRSSASSRSSKAQRRRGASGRDAGAAGAGGADFAGAAGRRATGGRSGPELG